MGRTHDVIISSFDLDRLESELTAVTEQRDRLLEEREQWRMSSVCRELREQRDRLAEALELLVTTDHESKEAFIERVKQALAAVKGGRL
jgi:hypothetical protein